MSSNPRPPKFITPLTIGAAFVVAVFGGANIMIEPERTLIWLLGILFLPVALGLIHLSRRNANLARRIGRGGGVRAGLVGAGVALATAFGFTFTDQMGWTGAEGQLSSSPVWLILLPLIAVFIELFSARLEARAGKNPDHTDD
jgi:hypothetical protein